LNKQTKHIKPKYKLDSLDPGVRTVKTVYSENHTADIGKNISTKIFKMLKELDIIRLKQNKYKGEFKKYKKACLGKLN
jgi:hypothetical protein